SGRPAPSARTARGRGAPRCPGSASSYDRHLRNVPTPELQVALAAELAFAGQVTHQAAIVHLTHVGGVRRGARVVVLSEVARVQVIGSGELVPHVEGMTERVRGGAGGPLRLLPPTRTPQW